MKGKLPMSRGLALLAGALSLALVTVLISFAADKREPASSIIQAYDQASSGQAAPGTQVADSKESEGKIVRQRAFSTWRYQVTENIDGLHIHVSFSDASVNDLQAYVAANRALLSEVVQIGGQSEVVITFVSTLSPDEFRTWAKAQGIQAALVELRTAAPGSTGRGTLFVRATADDPLPQDSLTSQGLPIKGVYSVHGTVDAGRLTDILADPQVYLVDVTPAWVRNDIARAGITSGIRPRANVKSPFWQMEELGLQNFSDVPMPVLTIVPVQLTPASDDWIEEPHR